MRRSPTNPRLTRTLPTRESRLIGTPHRMQGGGLVIYCQTTSVSAAHATHCATYSPPCRPPIRAFSGWDRTPIPTECREHSIRQWTAAGAVERIWHIQDSRESGLGFQVKIPETFRIVPSSLGGGPLGCCPRICSAMVRVPHRPLLPSPPTGAPSSVAGKARRDTFALPQG